MTAKNTPIAELLSIMQQLRDPESGCPWDLQQTFDSIVPYTIEETYEVADAIARKDMQDIKDELGDLLFQVVFYGQLGSEQGQFSFDDIASGISDKLIRRHPHVFASSKEKSNQDLSKQWDDIKAQERAESGKDNDSSLLANIPSGVTPLIKAHKLQKQCAKVGFDWPTLDPVVAKVREEIQEVIDEVAVANPNQQAVEEEVGDLLFSVVNLARHLNVNAESALIKANHKFEQRFRQVEQLLKAQGSCVADADLENMEAAWQRVKAN
ncbi:nucleoside triphosphate pyrophosphohydrolase [Paraglaciecola sp. 2405UD69-4]|uniref:nucleoside triphosphate pyrophosphohydrolase n=1 Tax=Paraglaciecola sp. 2405UD69-4 TaxID=3391836 RepID=UPI0039C8F392